MNPYHYRVPDLMDSGQEMCSLPSCPDGRCAFYVRPRLCICLGQPPALSDSSALPFLTAQVVHRDWEHP